LNEAEQEDVRARYTSGQPYFLFVGSLHPRKNLARLFKAFDIFCRQYDSSIRLLVAGEKMWWTEPIRKAFEGMEHRSRVIFCGRLNSQELHRVTASALAITYVSYFEGFGIPIVEAFRCGVPVITANVTAMPEVAGNAALLVDPFDENAIANAMQQMSENPDLRKELVSRGFERAKLFSWDQAAQKLWQSMLKTISESNKMKLL